MTMATLRESLARGPVDVRFIKSDGSERVMLATTNQALFVYDYKGTHSPEPRGVIRVWDILKGEWRSIREDRVIGWVAN